MLFKAGISVPAALCFLFVAISSCGKDSPTKPQVPARITLSPGSATLSAVGQTIQLTATVLDQEGKVLSGAVVTWTSSNPSVVKVDARGLATALINGYVQITAASGGVTANASLIVAQVPGRIDVTPSSSTLAALDETVQLNHTVFDSNGEPIPGAGVLWSSSDVSVATVSVNGLVTAVENGTAQITATSGSITGSASVTVAQSAGGIVISPMPVTLSALGETKQLSAMVLDANGRSIQGAQVSWVSSDLSVVLVSDTGGLATAIGNGAARITAVSGDAMQSVAVTVLQLANGVTIEPSSTSLNAIGETVLLTATVYDANSRPIPDAEVAWSSNDPSVATVGNDGLVTALMNGTTEITAASGEASASVTVMVMQFAGSLSIEPPNSKLNAIGETILLSATVLDANDQLIANAEVTWSSSDPTVATVNVEGLVTARLNGNTLITARSGDASGQASVTVMQTAYSIVIEPSSASMSSLGETLQLSATVFDPNDIEIADSTVDWSSSDPGVAMVTRDGLVTALMNGTTKITAASGEASASVTVMVMQFAGSLSIEPPNSKLNAIGETILLSATVLDANDQLIANAEVTWSSSDPTVATVNVEGLVTARLNGNTLITARSGDASGQASVTVMQTAYSIVIEPSSASMSSLGETLQLSATVFDPNDIKIADSTVDWSSSDPGVAMVTSDGLVTALMNGTTEITAESGGVSASASIVIAQASVSIRIEPPSLKLQSLGQAAQLTSTAYDANGHPVVDAQVIWSSSDNSVATVSIDGVVNAIGVGTAEIKAASGDAIASIKVMVSQSVSRIALMTPAVTLTALGETVQVTANVFDLNNTPIAGVRVVWSSGGPSVATVDGDGLVTAIGNGTAEITATAGTVSASVVIAVSQEPDDIDLSRASATLTSPGEIVRITATVRDANGHVISSAAVDWSSSNPSVATVSNSGLVRAVSNGSTRITARSDGVSVTMAVTVKIDILAIERQILVEFYSATDGPNWSNDTNWLSELPAGEWYGVNTNANGRVNSIDLQSNQLSGSIPSSIGRLSDLDTFWVPLNQLQGSIPTSIGNLSKLDDLDLRFNQLTGSIPSSIGNLDKLVELALKGNQLTGSIPSSFGNMSFLGLLDISHNRLTGSIPSSLGRGRIAFFNFNDNMLSGSLPSFLGQHRWLQEINLSNNADLTGSLPPWFCRQNSHPSFKRS